MDVSSQHLARVLNALATAVDQLQSFGYALYLETQALSWTQPRSISVSGEGFRIIENQHTQHFDRALTLGFAIQRDASRERSIIFSVLFAWNASHWFIQSSVEDEDLTRDTITEVLWESPEHYATTIDTAIEGLQQALTAVMSSVTHERIATCIATIERRQ
jgi:hypothetical protein